MNTDGTFNKTKCRTDVNSPKDDFAYWIDTKSRKGFLALTEMADKDTMTFISSWNLGLL
jgi:hypothetical protein